MGPDLTGRWPSLSSWCLPIFSKESLYVFCTFSICSQPVGTACFVRAIGLDTLGCYAGISVCVLMTLWGDMGVIGLVAPITQQSTWAWITLFDKLYIFTLLHCFNYWRSGHWFQLWKLFLYICLWFSPPSLSAGNVYLPSVQYDVTALFVLFALALCFSLLFDPQPLQMYLNVWDLCSPWVKELQLPVVGLSPVIV